LKDQATIAHEVETSYQAYSNAFNQREMETVLRYVAAPYVLTIGGNAPWVTETPEQVSALFDKNLQTMLGRGRARSDSKVRKVGALSEDHVLLLSDIIRFKTDGSVLEKGRYLYSLRRGGQSWQITGVTDIAPPFTGPGDLARE
jgi:hypothetical protein